jgi:hypothetical protein
VLAFYRSEEHTQEALLEARRNRLRRSAAIHRGEDGHLQWVYAGWAPRTRVVSGIVLGLILAFAAAALGFATWVDVLAGVSGLPILWFTPYWLGYGLRKRILFDHSRYVLPGEGLVIVRESRDPARAVEVLRRVSHASVFVIRPKLPPSVTEGLEHSREVVPLANLSDCASELADSHECAPSTKSRLLLPVLRECEIGIDAARADLAEATHLDYGVTNAAEWLLDNGYLIRSHIAEIRHNLPDNHNKILPVLAGINHPVQLRIYHLAGELIARTGSRITPEGIISFLEGYQTKTQLFIAELWVFPLMLRLVLLQRLLRLSEQTSVRQHQKELADFWADRLLNAANRDTDTFDRMAAKLDRDGTPTPHFIARLGEQLNKEESVLAPIHKWIEDKTGVRLADIILREHSEEANELMSIASTIGSLRQLSELRYPKIVESVSYMEKVLCEDPSGIHARSDFATRDRSRRIMEEVARQSKIPEWDGRTLCRATGTTGFRRQPQGVCRLLHSRRRLAATGEARQTACAVAAAKTTVCLSASNLPLP